jgi:Fe-S-cluster containining protein
VSTLLAADKTCSIYPFRPVGCHRFPDAICPEEHPGSLMTTHRFELAVAVALRALGGLEDEAAGSGWAWDAALSHRVDALRTLIEECRA